MKNKLFLFLGLFIGIYKSYSQNCNCPELLDWMSKTFEKNDAGFQYIIDKKGKDDYEKHNALITQKAKGALNLIDCRSVLYDWLHYFRPGHISLLIKDEVLLGKEVRAKYKNERTINLTEQELISILEKKKNKDAIEGIWSNGRYRVGIIADEKSLKKFIGFIIKGDSIYWVPKQVIMDITLNADNESYSVNYGMRDHSKKIKQISFTNENKSLFSLFDWFWTREYPSPKFTQRDKILVAFTNSKLPFIEKLSNKTIYFRVPSFAFEQKKMIDSILDKYYTLISSTPNLIIDIRNGTGGSDASYKKILDYLYTNPIRTVSVQLYATELNALAFERYAKQLNNSFYSKMAEEMRKNIGKFINISEKTFEIDTLEQVLAYPQKVAIICNQNNGSTDEQFLLAAKQSSKVKVFGRPTGGMLDISNMNFVDFPNGQMQLGYCMSKSYRSPNYCIDGIGIQPDYFIDDAISENDWIEYTRKILEQ